MSAVSARDKNLLLICGVLVLYAIAGLSYKKQSAVWKIEKTRYERRKAVLASEKQLIADRQLWAQRYEERRALMPAFPYERDVDTHWMNLMDSVAKRNGLQIARRQAGKEVEVGDVFELAVDVKDWEGTLESLVKFLYDLNKEGVMLDVRQLYVRPSNKPGLLKGTFTLYCAYMRGDEEREAPAVEGDTAGATNAPAATPAVDAGEMGETATGGMTNAPTASEDDGEEDGQAEEPEEGLLKE